MNRIGKICILLLAFPLWGMDWPSDRVRLESNFGANHNARPLMGTAWSGQGVVRAAETGELLFMRQSDDASGLPSPLGVWAAIDHGDGLISIYSSLDDKKLVSLPSTIEKGMVLGNAGASGWTEREGFCFSLFDRKERRYVNPAMIIPPLGDRKAPEIRSVLLKNSQNSSIELNTLEKTEKNAPIKSLSQGTYTVFIDAQDAADNTENTLAPFKLICALNGQELGAVTFETFFARDGVFFIYRNGLASVEQVYAESPYFEIGKATFQRGQGTLEIIAQDINENSQSVILRLNVD